MNRFKSFFQIVKYEFIRLARNKMVITMLLIFSLLSLCLLSFVKMDETSNKIAIYTDGLSMEQLLDQELISKNISDKQIIYVDSIDEGKDLVNSYKAVFFLAFNSDTKPVTAVLYYDSSSTIGKTTKENIDNAGNELAYNSITLFLQEYGITINENTFKLISFEPSNDVGVKLHQLPFSMELTVCLSFVIMFGLAFSISRDNETNINKNISYLPIGLNRYLIAKIFTYFILGMAELLLCLIIGTLFFGIHFQMNILLIWLLSSFFVLSTIMLGLVFSCCKNQIATALICTLSIVIPMFALSMVFIAGTHWLIQALLYALPVTLFIGFLNAMIYSGIIIWWYIPVFILQCIVYYVISILIMKGKTN